MKENMILAYLYREAVNFDIDEFLVMIGREELLTHEEELPLIAQALQGDTEAIERLLVANMRFVVSLARQYVANHIPLQQLIQAGVQGMEQAIMVYKPESENPLIKFAVPVMRDVICRYIQCNKPEPPNLCGALGARPLRGLIKRRYGLPMMDDYLQIRPFVLEHFLSVAQEVTSLMERDEKDLIDEVLSIVDGRTIHFAHRHYERFTQEVIREDAIEYGLDVDSVDFDDEEQFDTLCHKVASKRQDGCLEMSELKWLHVPYIVSLAQEYVQPGVALESLITSGLDAFGEAVKQYDTTREMSLKAFAEPSIREAMQGIINGGA
jgi:DNA-directed RNA polymerase sigma subunit (sigma70/sigma32)